MIQQKHRKNFAKSKKGYTFVSTKSGNQFYNLIHIIMTFFVEYNAKYIASYKSLKAAQNFIARKGLKDDEWNLLRILNSEGNECELN